MPDGRTAWYVTGTTSDATNWAVLSPFRYGGTPGQTQPSQPQQPVASIPAPVGSPVLADPAAAPTDPYAPPGATPSTPAAGPTPAQRDAMATLRQSLAQFGLESEAEWAYGLLTQDYSMAEILLELRSRPAHKQRFKAFHERSRTDNPVSEGEVLALEDSYRQVARTFGLPEGFYDSYEDFANLIVKNVSPSEYGSRLEIWDADLRDSDTYRLAEMTARGLSPGEMLAGYIDPDKALPLIIRRKKSISIGAAARRSGYGAITNDLADDLAAGGISEAQAQEGFGTILTAKELFAPLPGQTGDYISSEDQVNAFVKGNAAARRRVAEAARRRQVEFEETGGSMISREGLLGLRTADSTGPRL